MRLSLVTHRGVINVITKTKLFFLVFEVLHLQLQFATPSNDLLKYNKYGNQKNKSNAKILSYPLRVYVYTCAMFICFYPVWPLAITLPFTWPTSKDRQSRQKSVNNLSIGYFITVCLKTQRKQLCNTRWVDRVFIG